MKNILTIAGSDSSGGAGIQGDIKTISAHNHHALSVVTAVTAQNTTQITSIFPVDNVADQLDALSSDIQIDGIKIGMLNSEKNVTEVIRFIEEFAMPKQIPIVLDPLMLSTTKKSLVSNAALSLIENRLLSLVTVSTPNLAEAEYLSGKKINSLDHVKEAAEIIYMKTGVAVLIKGGHFESDFSVDLLFDGNTFQSFSQKRLNVENAHGTGCCLSSSIVCHLANKKDLTNSIALAKRFVTMAINHGYSIGKGEGPVDPLIHFITNFVTMNDVANTCIAVGGRPMMAEAIEEMSDVVPINNGLVINLGTLSKSRLEVMMTALNFINIENQHVLLDPVGCGSSYFRLKAAKEILSTGKVSILKMNPREAMALLDDAEINAYGVDSDEMDLNFKKELAMELLARYSIWNKNLIAVITGDSDIVAYKNETHAITGGTSMQKKITGTGCMLNAIIMTFVAKSISPVNAVISALKQMNKASLMATRKLKNKKHTMTYKELLINELSFSHKDVYLITDEKLDFSSQLLPKTIEALKMGVTILQYRSKNKSATVKFEEATKLRKITEKYGVIFIINDDINLAKLTAADGVHLGADDESVKKARTVLGDYAIIGATAKTVDQAMEAEKHGADYLGVGALYASPTKADAIPVSLNLLDKIRQSVDIPIYGIGGIRQQNLTKEIVKTIDGVALVSAVYSGEKDELKNIINKLGQI